MIEKKFKEEKARIRQEIQDLPGVVGVGVGMKETGGKRSEELSIRVYVTQKMAAGELGGQAVPASFTLSDGTVIRTDVVEVGDVRFTGFSGKFRPAQPGCMLSHVNAEYAGTFGALVRDNLDGQDVILSASHSLANFNNAAPGDAVVQPAASDGGTLPEDKLGTLKRFVPLNMEPYGENFVDAAIAEADKKRDVRDRSLCSQVDLRRDNAVGLLYAGSAYITVINPISTVLKALDCTMDRTVEAAIGMPIHKCGGATGYTSTTISDIHVDLLVSTPEGNPIWFMDQIVTAGGVSDAAAGDSGAVWYTNL